MWLYFQDMKKGKASSTLASAYASFVLALIANLYSFSNIKSVTAA